MKVSLVIPAYNEEKTIYPLLKSAQEYVDEIIVVVARHSHDRTFAIAEKHADVCIRDSGKGKGAALKEGVERATHHIIIFIDADGSHNPHDIPLLLKPIKDNGMDLVVGSRARGGSDELHGTLGEFIRNTGGALVMLSINYFFNVRFTDCENGFRAIKKEVFTQLHLSANDFDIEQEMFIKALKRGYQVIEVPIHEYRREYGTSRLNLFKSGWKFFFGLRHLL